MSGAVRGYCPLAKNGKRQKWLKHYVQATFLSMWFLILFRQEQICDSANPFVTSWHFPCKGNLPCPTLRRKKFRVWMNFFEIHNKHFVPFSFSPPNFQFVGDPRFEKIVYFQSSLNVIFRLLFYDLLIFFNHCMILWILFF